MKFWRRELIQGTRRAIRGYWICKKIRLKYGKDTYIFITRGKTGDIYLYFRFLKNFIEKNKIEKYVLIGDCKNMTAIKKLYPYIDAPCIETSEYIGLCLQTAYCFFGAENLNVSLSLMWDVDLPVNRCATRLTQKFNFIDSYYWFLFDLDRSYAKPIEAQFSAIDDKIKSFLDKKGVIKGKTVIISPYAYCVRLLPECFWELLAKNLKNLGYNVFFMLDEKTESNNFGFPSLFFKYIDSMAVLEYAGHFIGLRSGFCDIISGAKCNKVILYPVVPETFDGSVHRADADYSSFKNMELANDAHEITVPFARDICNNEPENENLYSRLIEDKKMIADILKCFPSIRNGDVRDDKNNKRAHKKTIKKT